MALSDALEAERGRAKKGPACQVCSLLDVLDDADRESLLSALVDFSLSGEAISRALLAEGHDIQGQTVQRHRRRRCRGAV